MSRPVRPTGGRRVLRVVTAAVTICACIALQGGRDTAVAGGTVGVATPPLRAPLPAPAVPPRLRPGATVDRPDPFIPPSAAATAAAGVTAPRGVWLETGPHPIGYVASNDGFPPPFSLQGGTFGGENGGRVDSLVVIPAGSHAGRVVAGTAGGGVWVMDPPTPGSRCPSWCTTTDAAPSLAIGALAVDPLNPNHVVAGTGEANQCGNCFPGDGLLVSTDGGFTWKAQNPTYTSTGATTYTDFTATDPAAHWAVNQWAGALVRSGTTFATVATNSATQLVLAKAWPGADPLAGASFSVKSFDGEGIAEVAFDPANAQHQYAATTRGLFITNDGGSTWAKPTTASYGAVDGNITAVVVVPGSAGPTLYLGGGSQQVAQSTDGGVTWNAANANMTVLPPAVRPYTALALAPTNPATLYASVGNTTTSAALYRATDGPIKNFSWAPVTVPDYTGYTYSFGNCVPPCPPEQGYYDDVVAVDPANANHILAGGETVVESTNGGATWQNVNGVTFNSPPNPLHPDQHAIAFAPNGSIWIGNDGGVYRYGGGTITNENFGLAAAQFYFGFTEVPSRGVFGGLQDNGTTEGYPSAGWFGQPGKELQQGFFGWQGISGGDGGPTAAWTFQTTKQGPVSTYGLFEADSSLFVNGPDFPLTGSAVDITPVRYSSSTATSFTATSGRDAAASWTANQWAGFTVTDGANTAAIAGNTANTLTLKGTGWSPAVPANGSAFTIPEIVPFTPPMVTVPNARDPANPTVFFGGADLWRSTNPTSSSPAWTKVTSGLELVSAIAVAPSDPNTVYVAFQDGNVEVSTDGGLNFTPLGGQPFAETWVTGLSVNPQNPKEITASVSYAPTRSVNGPLGGANPHVAQYTWSATPGGGSWTVITGNLPVPSGVSRVIYDNGALVAATDVGVYATTAANGASTVWAVAGKGLPRVQVQDLYLDPQTGVLFAVTFGRGAWELHRPIFGAAIAGDNSSRELGGGSSIQFSPKPFIGCCPTNVATTVAGETHMLALLTNGTVMAWGSDFAGQLGGGAYASFSSVPVKVKLPAGAQVKALAGGGEHSLALLSDGSLLAWGNDSNGELGDGQGGSSNVPVAVHMPAGAKATAIAAGSNFSLALLTDGTVLAWGSNSNGQLGSSRALHPSSALPIPVQLPAGATVTGIAAGAVHALARLSDGSLLAWGYNGTGQLGNGSTNESDTPVPVSLPAGTSVTAIAGGFNHSLAAVAGGGILAWGDNTDGELGNGTNTGPNCGGTCSDVPVSVTMAPGVEATAVSAGNAFSMALLSSNAAVSWGDNEFAQLGTGTCCPSSNVPVTECDKICGPLSIAAGWYDSAITLTEGTVS